jgi:putative flippase GtrA
MTGPYSLRTLLLDPAESTLVQFFRYVIVGGLAFVLDFGTLYACTEWGRVNYLISAAAGFVIGLSFNYALSRKWVFSHRTLQSAGVEFGVFAIIGFIGLGMNEAGMWFLAEILKVHYLMAKIITTVVVFAWNFLARKYSLFR